MKKLIYSLSLILIVTFGCDNDDVRVFDKTADERSAEAIATLKSDLTSAENGWLVKYRPVDETGSYYVLLTFHENNKVTIQTDLGADNGEYQNQTIGYRIDSSLGLELILENYSFFSYLFELDQASFGAEYEFNYSGKTDTGELVFTSKTDPAGAATEIVFQPATAGSTNLLGQAVGINLDAFTNDLDRFSSALKLTYVNKDLEFYISLDAVKRVISFNLAARKSNPNVKDDISESTGYYLEGNDLVLEDPVQTNVSGATERVERISLDVLGETSLNVCTEPFIVHTYTGQIGTNDITLETTIADLAGATFATASDFYYCPLSNIRREGLPLVDEITTDVAGALEFHLYYDLELANGDELNGIGFVIQNNNGTITFALKEFTPVLNGNNIVFNFEPGFTLFGEQTTDANLDNINKYLDALTAGNTTYVFKYAEDIYEFNNPCTGWSFVFINGN
jgi:hypothetical protein